ncbi:hypothetical protein [Lactiplantibacillus daowaiensis]|uniref:Uncharacterized protein n=1 Tax=Lactiplantibacillus daowaiensis TaxID=2559918 RepID=A0ABW1S131_9LACO|nr:hypothetical protein [Lactiplantibacillus daowaiensis]
MANITYVFDYLYARVRYYNELALDLKFKQVFCQYMIDSPVDSDLEAESLWEAVRTIYDNWDASLSIKVDEDEEEVPGVYFGSSYEDVVQGRAELDSVVVNTGNTFAASFNMVNRKKYNLGELESEFVTIKGHVVYDADENEISSCCNSIRKYKFYNIPDRKVSYDGD